MRTRRSARFQEVEMIDRRKLLLQTFGAAGLVAFAAPLAFADDAVLVYKSPTCGCCAAWIEHLRAAGFSVRANNVVDMSPVKTRLGVPQSMWSCHTAVVGDYVIEGHVPAGDIRRLLQQGPSVAGIAVPGMPAGSPGMEIDGYSESYTVWAFGDAGIETFALHE